MGGKNLISSFTPDGFIVNTRLNHPRAEVVREYVGKFDDPSSQTGQTDLALRKLFASLPFNAELGDVLLKTATLNALYATNIFAIYQVAKHIHNLQIDTRLAVHDRTLVEDIAQVQLSNSKKRRNYSFATKYCSWHSPETFPIYDSFVDNLLWHYAQQDSFFGGEQLGRYEFWNDYRKFARTMEAFRDYYNLRQFTLRQIDKFLWLYARALSGLSE